MVFPSSFRPWACRLRFTCHWCGINDACDHGDGSQQGPWRTPSTFSPMTSACQAWTAARPSACSRPQSVSMPTTCHGLPGTEAWQCCCRPPLRPPTSMPCSAASSVPRIPTSCASMPWQKALLKRNIRLVLSGQPAFWVWGARKQGSNGLSVSLWIRSKVLNTGTSPPGVSVFSSTKYAWGSSVPLRVVAPWWDNWWLLWWSQELWSRGNSCGGSEMVEEWVQCRNLEVWVPDQIFLYHVACPWAECSACPFVFIWSVGLLAKEYMNAFLMLYSIAERHKIEHKDHFFSMPSPEVTTKDGAVYSLFSLLSILDTCTSRDAHVLLASFLFHVWDHIL